MLQYPDMHLHISADADLNLHKQVSPVFLNATSFMDFDTVSKAAGNTVFPFYGVHPWYASTAIEDGEQFSSKMKTLLERAAPCGIGECGLDFSAKYKDSFDTQLAVFETQLALSSELHRPLSIHCVRAWEPMLRLLRKYSPLPSPFILHSFYGSKEIMQQLVEMGGYISLSAISLRNPQKTAPVIQSIPINRIFIESDLLTGSEDITIEGHFKLLKENYKNVAVIKSLSEPELISGVIENGKIFTN